MATVDELLAGVATVDKTLVISNDFRTINIPSSVPNLGVEYDDDVLRLDFKMPRYVSDTDLSEFSIRINYINSQGETDVYTVKDKTVGSQYITFNWLVGPTATRYRGNTKFNICAKTLNTDGNVDKEFNTTIATLPVLEGLEVDEGVVTAYSDIIEQWRQELFGIGDTEEASIKAVSEAEQTAIVNKGAEVLATIPVDYQTAISMTDNADRTKADSIACSTEGEAVLVKDSSDDYLRGMKVFGKTTQMTTTGKQLININQTTKTNNGITFTTNADGSIHVKGTATGEAYYIFDSNNSITVKETELVATLKGSDKAYMVVGYFKDDGTVVNSVATVDDKTVDTFVYPTESSTTRTFIGVNTGVTIDATVYPMIRLASNLDDRYEPYSGGVASPSPAWPQQLASIENPKIDILGKNLIKYPYVNTSTVSNGITFTANSDGTVTATGTATGTAYLTLQNIASHSTAIPIPKGKYVLSGAPVEYCRIAIGLWKNKKRGGTESAYVHQPFNLVIDEDDMLFDIVCTVDNGAVLNNVVFRPQLEVGNEPTPYEPYVEKQTVTPEHVLLGIPVSQNGNRTDSNGQQWICDEIDFERGVCIKRVGTKVFDGSTDEIWHNDSLVLDNTVMFRIEISDSVNVGNIVGKDYLCSNFPVKNMYNSDVEGTQHTMKQFYFRLNKSTLTTVDMDGFRQYLAAHPMTVQYVLAEPIESPLTAEELEWFRFAHTNFPTTTVLNDAGATMELKYNADTKTWLENLPKASDEQVQNAVNAWFDEGRVPDGGVEIDDENVSTNKTWSSRKISNSINGITPQEIGAVTHKELQDAINSLEIPEGGGGGVEIDDEDVWEDKTWSSQKIVEYVDELISDCLVEGEVESVLTDHMEFITQNVINALPIYNGEVIE